MPDIQSVYSKIGFFEDFNGIQATAQLADATAGTRWNDVCIIAVSGTLDLTHPVDRSGGLIAFNGGGGAADGVCLTSAPMQPSTNGTIVMEARFKGASATDLRVFVGWQETTDLAETVNPFTLSGTTLTSNDGGQAVGFYTDTSATTDDFRFHASSDGTELTSSKVTIGESVRGINTAGATTLGALGIRAGVTLTADSWYIARVEIDPDGRVRGYFGHTSMANKNGLTLVATLAAGALDQTALYFPVVHLLAGSTGDPVNECDYFGATGHRSWAA